MIRTVVAQMSEKPAGRGKEEAVVTKQEERTAATILLSSLFSSPAKATPSSMRTQSASQSQPVILSTSSVSSSPSLSVSQKNAKVQSKSINKIKSKEVTNSNSSPSSALFGAVSSPYSRTSAPLPPRHQQPPALQLDSSSSFSSFSSDSSPTRTSLFPSKDAVELRREEILYRRRLVKELDQKRRRLLARQHEQ
jgi:hypothetical protein